MDQTPLFLEHKSTVRTLQRSLIQEIDAWSEAAAKEAALRLEDNSGSDSDSTTVTSPSSVDNSDITSLSSTERVILSRAATDYIHDAPTVFRHLKTARYDVTVARQNIRETLRWRRSMSVHRPGHWLHRGLLHSGACRVIGRDPQGRQTLWLNLDALSRSTASRDEVRLFTVGMLEALRLDTRRRFGKDGRLVQCVCVLDLAGVGVASMDTELAPFVLDLLLNRFPSCFAAVYVLNYSWMYAGVWSLIKRLIPESSRGRVVFPSKTELKERLGVSMLPEDASNYDPDTCKFLTQYRKQVAINSDDDTDAYESDNNTTNAPTNDEDTFYDAPLWPDTEMQAYADERIATLERQLAQSQKLVKSMEQQLTLTRTPKTKSLAIYKRVPKLLYAMGPRQIRAAFAWWLLSARGAKQFAAQWWTRRATNRGFLYWLVALLITREGIAALFGEVMMRVLTDTVHLRGLIA
ncbi:CRAL-TRIO domain-containing protein [Syncephalis fuscata]|nr:CRAL-TRIO domain-containing protein [Syncephalis fuscata]